MGSLEWFWEDFTLDDQNEGSTSLTLRVLYKYGSGV